jgi:hypothetical protein
MNSAPELGLILNPQKCEIRIIGDEDSQAASVYAISRLLPGTRELNLNV